MMFAELQDPKATWNSPNPVVFSALNLIVKHGPKITVTEGQCLGAIQRLLPSVPVPEVYGWCREQGETFLYMQLVEGITLEQARPNFDIEDKYESCQQLQGILENLRLLNKSVIRVRVKRALVLCQMWNTS